MSSFLGRTGNNIRVVLDFARRAPSVLLLDEFDAIAKRRNDATEVGELKRLVTVLLQSVDDWPTGGILVAATNHPELLDPAVWRRFDRVVEFPLPNVEEIASTIKGLLGNDEPLRARIGLLATLLCGRSFADVSRVITTVKRSAIVGDFSIIDAIDQLTTDLAASLTDNGKSQREVSSITGLSRDTIRSHLSGANGRRTKTA